MGTHDGTTPKELRSALDDVEEARAAIRLAAVITYKAEPAATLAEVAGRFGYTAGWLSRWISRLDRADEPPASVVTDDPKPGRPPRLPEAAFGQFATAVNADPGAAGFEAAAWTVPLAREFLETEFDVAYSPRHVRRLLSRAGLAPQPAESTQSPAAERDAGGRVWLSSAGRR